jgi:hypothetical protein
LRSNVPPVVGGQRRQEEEEQKNAKGAKMSKLFLLQFEGRDASPQASAGRLGEPSLPGAPQIKRTKTSLKPRMNTDLHGCRIFCSKSETAEGNAGGRSVGEPRRAEGKLKPLLVTLLLGLVFFLPAAHTWGQQTAGEKSSSSATDEQWRDQFKPRIKPLGSATSAPTAQLQTGKVTYTMHGPTEPTEEEAKILKDAAASVDKAAKIYNTCTKLKKELNVYYSPDTPTADGNINGSIRFGKNARNLRIFLHEMGHTMGVGQHGNWGKLMVNGVWQGKRANKLLQEFTNDPKAELHGDRMHFWPYGLNFDSEVKSDEDFIRHAKIVEAMVEDMEKAN